MRLPSQDPRSHTASLAEAVRRVMLRTGAGPLRPLWALAYRLCARAAGAYLRRGRPEVAVYSLGDVAGPDVAYGVSDIDLAVVAPDGVGRELAGRWERLARRVPPLRDLVHAAAYEARELERGDAGAPSLSFGGPAGPGLRAALDQPSFYIKPPDASLRAGFGLPRAEWRLLAGADRRGLAGGEEEHDPRVAAWLELQFWWRHAFSVCRNPDGPRAASTCVKLISEPVRVWLWLERGERPPTRRAALERGLEELPEEAEAIGGALALQRELHRSPEAPLAATLDGCLRLTARIARCLEAEAQRAGGTEVRMTWGGEPELALATGARDPLRALLGAEPRVLPLADSRALVYVSDADETFTPVPHRPDDPAALAACTLAGSDGPYPALEAGGLLVLPAPGGHRTKMRAIECAPTAPVAFALLAGAATARFPNVGGWSIQEIAARAVAESGVWLRRRAVPPGAPDPAALLLSSARAALLLESIEAGRPDLPLTVAATAARLAERDGAAGVAEATYEAHARWRAGGPEPPQRVLDAMHRCVTELPAYRELLAPAGVRASMSR